MIGMLSKENAKWLYDMGVVTKRGGICKNNIDMEYQEKLKLKNIVKTKEVIKETCSWSVYCELRDAITEDIRGHDDYSHMTVDIDDITTIIRTGSIAIKYKMDGREYEIIFSVPVKTKERIAEWKRALSR